MAPTSSLPSSSANGCNGASPSAYLNFVARLTPNEGTGSTPGEGSYTYTQQLSSCRSGVAQLNPIANDNSKIRVNEYIQEYDNPSTEEIK